MLQDENEEDVEFWPFCGIAPLKSLADKTELFTRHGKAHWCFKPNFDALTPKRKIECKKYYDIKPREIKEVHPYAVTADATIADSKAIKKGAKKGSK